VGYYLFFVREQYLVLDQLLQMGAVEGQAELVQLAVVGLVADL